MESIGRPAGTHRAGTQWKMARGRASCLARKPSTGVSQHGGEEDRPYAVAGSRSGCKAAGRGVTHATRKTAMDATRAVLFRRDPWLHNAEERRRRRHAGNQNAITLGAAIMLRRNGKRAPPLGRHQSACSMCDELQKHSTKTWRYRKVRLKLASLTDYCPFSPDFTHTSLLCRF